MIPVKLILIFGFWVNPLHITNLYQRDNGCRIYFNYTYNVVYIADHNCDEVAQQINNQIEEIQRKK